MKLKTDPGAAGTDGAGTGADGLVSHNTRIPARLRRAMDLVAAGGLTRQQQTIDAIREYLERHHRAAFDAVGDREAEVSLLADQLSRRRYSASREAAAD